MGDCKHRVPFQGQMVVTMSTSDGCMFCEHERMHAALTKISAIRDSIVGMQGFNFSEHAYPLVAALAEAGFTGAGYEISRANLGTLIEQRDAAERERDAARAEVARLRPVFEAAKAWNAVYCASPADEYPTRAMRERAFLCQAVNNAEAAEKAGR